MSTVSRLRNLFLNLKNNGYERVMKKALGGALGDPSLHSSFPVNLLQANHIISEGLDSLICNVKELGKIFTVPSTPNSHDSFFYHMNILYVVFSIMC